MMMNNNMNNQMMMNNTINQNRNDKMKELLEELDYMRNKVNLYAKRIKTLEERIKEKDTEIINLRNMLSRNFNYNQNMQQINYNHYPMMMGQINNFMNYGNQTNNNNNMAKEDSSEFLTINFIFDDRKIAVQGTLDMTIEKLIKNFRLKLGKEVLIEDYFFKENKIDKDSKLTLQQSGISNKDDIYVFDQNDKIKQENISKMLSHKNEIIVITFNVSTGNKVQISFRYYTKISTVLESFCNKIGFQKYIIEKDIMFLYNGEKLTIGDNRTIGEISGGKDSILISVYDLEGVIGA